MDRILTTKDIGTAIRKERKRQGYTQVQLSELTGIGVSYIGNIERGKVTAEIGKALELLTLLGIDIFVQKRGE
jgi:y4mF family transcriptional regulator